MSLAVSDHILRIHGTLADNITVLLKAKIKNLRHFLIAFADAIMHTKPWLVLAAVTAWCVFLAPPAHLFRDPKLWIILVGAASVVGPIATGYVWGTRYISPLVVATALAGWTELAECIRRSGYARRIARVAQFACVTLVGLTLINISIEPWRSEFSQNSPDEIRAALRMLQPSEVLFSRLRTIHECFLRSIARDPLLHILRYFASGRLVNSRNTAAL